MIVDRACARSRRCAIESVTALGAAYKTLHDAGRDGPPRRMSLVGLEPFQRERKGLFADDRRHGERDPIPPRLLVPGAVWDCHCATQPHWPTVSLARLHHRVREAG